MVSLWVTEAPIFSLRVLNYTGFEDPLTVQVDCGGSCLDTSRSKHLRYDGDKIELASSAFVTVVIKLS